MPEPDFVIDDAFADLVARYLDDALSESEHAALTDRLRADATHRRFFWLACRTAQQRHDYGREPAAPVLIPKPRGAAQRTPGVSRRIPVASALAAAVLLAAAAVAIYVFAIDPQSAIRNPKSASPPVATLIESTGTVIYEDDIANPGSEYATGTYSIDSGSAEFMLDSRVTVNLHGETRMVMHDDMHVSLTRGNASFVVPKDATGFTVHLPDQSKVVDLGTAFSVKIDDEGQAEVRVTEGAVEWAAGGGTEEPVRITVGQTARVADAGFAISVPVGNASFEATGDRLSSPNWFKLPEGGDWVHRTENVYNILDLKSDNNHFAERLGAVNDGTRVLNLTGSIEQELAYTVERGQAIKLTFLVGASAIPDRVPGDLTASIVIDGVSAVDDTFTNAAPRGRFVDHTTQITAPRSGVLSVRFTNGRGLNWIDDVRIEVHSPFKASPVTQTDSPKSSNTENDS